MDADNLFFTIITGVLVFVFSQMFLEFVLRPIQEYKKLKGEVAKGLILYAQFYYNPYFNEDGHSEGHSNASDRLRELASEVAAFKEMVPSYLITYTIIPTKKDLQSMSENLIGLSNSCYTTKTSKERYASLAIECESKIEKVLGIKKR